MLRRANPFFAPADHHRFSFAAAPGRAIASIMEKDSVFGKLSFTDRACFVADALRRFEQQAATRQKKPAIGKKLGVPVHTISSLATLECIADQFSPSRKNNKSKPRSACDGGGDVAQQPLHAFYRTSNKQLEQIADELQLPESDFVQYRDSIHYHLLAGLPQRELAVGVTPESRRVAVIFRLIRAHGWQQLYSDEQVREARRDVDANFSDTFIQAHFEWSHGLERYMRRRLLVDASVHEPVLGPKGDGSPEALCQMAWLLLFQSMKARFPRKVRRRPVPAMLYLHTAVRKETEHLPFLERVAVMLRDPTLEQRLQKAEEEYQKTMAKPIVNVKGNMDSAIAELKSEQRFRQSVFHPWSSLHILEKTKSAPRLGEEVDHASNGDGTATGESESNGDGDGSGGGKSALHEDAWSLWAKRNTEQQQQQQQQQQMKGSSIEQDPSEHKHHQKRPLHDNDGLDELDPYSVVLRAVAGDRMSVPLPSNKRLTPEQLAKLDDAAEAAHGAALQQVSEQEEERKKSRVEQALKLMYDRDTGGRGIAADDEPVVHPRAPVPRYLRDTPAALRMKQVLPRRLMNLVRSAVYAVRVADCRDPSDVPPRLLRVVEKAMASVKRADMRPCFDDVGPELEAAVNRAMHLAARSMCRQKRRQPKLAQKRCSGKSRLRKLRFNIKKNKKHGVAGVRRRMLKKKKNVKK